MSEARHRHKECYDCLIVGGGPAGAALAAILADWDRQVALVHCDGPRPVMPEETLVPTAKNLLDRLGLLPIIQRHQFFGTPRHGSIWRERDVRWRLLPESERGYKVERGLFDRELRERARHRGVTVLSARATALLWEDASAAVRITKNDGTTAIVRGRVIAVATGKLTEPLLPIAVEHEFPATLALAGDIDSPPPDFGDATVVESVSEGWLWWLPLHDGRVCLTLFCDRDEVRKRGREPVWMRAIAGARGPAHRFDTLPARGTVATPRFQSTSLPVLLVGDAASMVDPLSSQGLEKALASAETAAYAVNTCIERPQDLSLIKERHSSWERGLFLAHARQALEFYSNEDRFPESPFWQDRHAAAVAQRRPRQPLPARLGKSPYLEKAPVLRRRGRLLERCTGFRIQGENTPDEIIDRLGEVEVSAVFEILTENGSIEDALKRAALHPQLLTLSPLLLTQVLDELFQRGFLVDADS